MTPADEGSAAVKRDQAALDREGSKIRPIFHAIAADALGIETLGTRDSDRLDFHEVSVESIATALEQAYRAGADEALKAVEAEEIAEAKRACAGDIALAEGRCAFRIEQWPANH